ncbi:MAG: DNA repair protein RecO [Thermodesulfobacterium geofontis]|uniref:DNA repair protein RecO n=1 Tax=Thermodesulfobacterium geofontis TaxID=1295609 RepID=A0A2N7QEJ2_9BACT|nr:MAG: DNA repair protein RecO [Thermodesulfobacterium geofontis]PMP97061.1 MAG: DNA repair protein RecO [Thermodesulfobacterium geofontis]
MIFSLEALVLSKEKLGEIDLLVELFTPKGKIWSIAKGAQKSRKRFVNLLEEFNFIKAHLRKTSKGKFPILEKADLLFLPESIRNDYRKYIMISYMGEILSKINFYGLFVEYFSFIKILFKEIEKNELILLLKPFFELKILKFSGWSPEFFQCVKCGYKPKKVFYLSIPEGGILCFKCKDENSESINLETIEVLRNLIEIPVHFEKLKKLEKDLEKSIEVKEKIFKISEKFFKYFLPFEWNSLKFLNLR